MDVKEFENILASEKQQLEETLGSMSKRTPSNANNWEATFPDLNIGVADKSEWADVAKEFDTALGVNAILEERYHEVLAALLRIKQGTFGMCEKDGKPIDEKRLAANAAARTCIEHS